MTKKFDVLVYRTVYEYAIVRVEAETEAAAVQDVQAKIHDQRSGDFDWAVMSVVQRSIETDGAEEVEE